MNAAQELAVEFELPNRLTPQETEALDRASINRLAVGQTVWIKYDYNRTGLSAHRVEKIGRKWVHFSGQTKAERGSRRTFGSHGRIYLSQEEYHAEAARNAAWHDFKHDLAKHYAAPPGVTPEAIHAARAWLGLVAQ